MSKQSITNSATSQTQIPNYITDPNHWMNTMLVPFTTEGIGCPKVSHVPLSEALAHLSSTATSKLSALIKAQAKTFRKELEKVGLNAHTFSKKAELPPAKLKLLSALYDKIGKNKAQLPYACFAVGFEVDPVTGKGHRANANVVSFTGLTQIDFDHLPDHQRSEKLIKISEAPGTAAVFTSPSGDGIKIIYRIPIAKDEEEYKKFHRIASYYLADLVDVDYAHVDMGVKDTSRACYIPADSEHCYINENAEADEGLRDLPDPKAIVEAPDDVTSFLQANGGQANALGAVGGGAGERQPGYRNVNEFRNLFEPPLPESADKTRKNSDGSTTFGWYITCPSASGHAVGGQSKTMVFFNADGNVRYPAGYKCFSPACEEHGWKWFAQQMGMPGQGAAANAVFEMNKEYTFTMMGGISAQIARRITDPYDEGLYRWVFMSPQDFRVALDNEYINKRVVSGTGANRTMVTKETPAGTEWIGHPERRQKKDGIVCDPTGKDHETYLNVFPGWGVAPERGTWTKMRKHIQDIICGGDQKLFEWLLDWMAYPFLNLDSKAPTGVAPVLVGLEGCGKGTFVQWLLKIYGPTGAQVKRRDDLTGTHASEFLADKSFVFADEALYAGNAELQNILKGLVTETSLTINPKHKTMYQMDKVINYILASNEEWVVDIQEENRRFCVIEVSGEKIKDFKYFKALEKEATSGGVEAMLWDLLQRNPDAHTIKDFPDTKGTRNQQKASCAATYFFAEIEDLEDHWLGSSATDEVIQIVHEEAFVSKKALYDVFAQYMKDQRKLEKGGVPRRTPNAKGFYRLMTKFFGEQCVPETGVWVPKNGDEKAGTKRGVFLPSAKKLAEFRAQF